MDEVAATLAEGIEGSYFPGPYPAGSYAAQLKRRLQDFARVQLVGEVWGLRPSRVRVYFELRDARGALPCSMWRNEFDALGTSLSDGMRVVVGGGCDYYPAAPRPRPPSPSASPSCASPVRETCWWRSSGCDDGSTPTGCSSHRSGWPGRRCPARSAWSPASAARRVTTSWPACAAGTGVGGSSGPSSPSRTATPPRGSPPRYGNWPRSKRSRW